MQNVRIMVQIFACATALLSPEFVEGFEPETLASKFIKVEKEYSVKFKKTKSSFNITGHWKSVQDAHCSLLQLIPDKRSAGGPKSRPPEKCTASSDPRLVDQTPDGPSRVTTVDEEDHHEISPAETSTGPDPFYSIKGNPKRGRHVPEKNQASNVPEPYFYIHFQDQSFADENSVNMEKVLDEFEKGPASNNVTKEDLKKVLEKNIEQMGRPLNKVATKGATIAENKEIQHTMSRDSTANQKINETMIDGKQFGNNVSFESHAEGENVVQRDLSQASLTLTKFNDKSQTIGNVQQHTGTMPFSNDVTTLGNSEGNVSSMNANTAARLYSTSLNSSTVATDMFQGTDTIEGKETWEDTVHMDSDHQSVTTQQIKEYTKKPANETAELCLVRGDIEQVEFDENNFQELKSHTQSQAPNFGYLNSKNMDSFERTDHQEISDVVKKSLPTVNKEKKERKVKGQANKNRKKKKPSEVEQKIQKDEGSQVTATELQTDQTLTDTGNQKVENKDTVFKCPHCDYQGSKKKRLTEHMGRVHGLLTENCRGAQDSAPFSCNLCDKSFVFGKDLNRHKKIVHHGNRFYCEKCNKLYKSKYVFDKHMGTHADGYVQPMFKCQVCSREFTTKFSLGCHIKSEHLGLKKTYICPTCGKSFSQIRSYRQHANVHAGIRPYVCEICGKSFTYDKSLKEHRYMHDDVRRFPCTVCNKAFRQRTCLLIHMKVHKDSKDHICSSCGKSFTQKQSLIRHERIHTGDKPYLCRLCSKSFSDYAVIRKHLLMSHKKDKNDWKEFVVAEEKKMSDHYIAGGPGYVKRETSEKIREKNQATIIPAAVPGGRPFIVENVQRDFSRDVQSEVENVNIVQTDRSDVRREQLIKENLGASDYSISQSNLAGYQVLLYANTDTDQGQGQIQPIPKQDSQVQQATVNLSYPVNYSTLQNLANSAYVISPVAEHVNVTDENMLSNFGSTIMAPLPGVNTANLEHDPRVQNLNPSILNSQTTVLDLGQPGSNVTSSSAVISATEPLPPNMSLTAAALSAWGLNGYQTYFNQSNLNQFQQQE